MKKKNSNKLDYFLNKYGFTCFRLPNGKARVSGIFTFEGEQYEHQIVTEERYADRITPFALAFDYVNKGGID
jgi:hypothetical protein